MRSLSLPQANHLLTLIFVPGVLVLGLQPACTDSSKLAAPRQLGGAAAYYPEPQPFQPGSAETAADRTNPWLSGWGGAVGTADNPTSQRDHATDGPLSAIAANADGTAASAEAEATAALPMPALIMTAYREGSDAERMLELSNVGPDASGVCELRIYSNGSLSASRSLVLPEEWPGDAVLTICTSNDPWAPCDLSWGGSLYNGNDSLVISCKDSEGTDLVLDAFGQLGFDPGEAWQGQTDSSVSAKDQTLLRCPGPADVDPYDLFVLDQGWVVWQPDAQKSEALALCLMGQGGGPG